MTTDLLLDDDARSRFGAAGFVVLRDVFDPGALGQEVDASLDAGVRVPGSFNEGPGNRFQYVPMMTRRTPHSLALLDALVAPARQLLGADPIPTRAKGTRYSGTTSWHRDSEAPIASVGFLAYLEPLVEATGALRVVEGSHRPPYPDPPVNEAGSAPVGAGDEVAVATEPGDLIAFDEHLLHSSEGGGLRRQWRVDFVATPASADADAATRSYFAGIFSPTWDGGYDVDRFPSYDADWRSSTRPWTATMATLGAYESADAQESFVRRGRG